MSRKLPEPYVYIPGTRRDPAKVPDPRTTDESGAVVSIPFQKGTSSVTCDSPPREPSS